MHWNERGLNRLRKKDLFLADLVLGADFFAACPCFAAVFCFRFASGSRFIDFQAHFGPNGPALQSGSASASAPNSAPRWSSDRTNPLDQGRAASPGATPGPAC